MSIFEICFQGAPDGAFVEFAVGGVEADKRQWIPVDQILQHEQELKTQRGEFFFGPAPRATSGKMGKANCLGSGVCWVDVDHTDEKLIPPLPPTAVVFSGHGRHYYWQLDGFCAEQKAIEMANVALAATVRGDSAHNIDRLLRVPGSWNTGEKDNFIRVRLEAERPVQYTIEDIQACQELDHKTINKITTGDRRGFKSRSERDWAVVTALLAAGVSEESIINIFTYQACGDKYREEPKGQAYLARTIEKILEKGPSVQSSQGLIEDNNCYYAPAGKSRQQISTFVISPTLLLEGEDEDSIVGDISASGTDFVWKDIILPKSAFNNVHSLSKNLPRAAWVWLGRDSHVRGLLAHLMVKLQEAGVPRARATSYVGRQSLNGDDRSFYVCNSMAIASDGSEWIQADSPIVYVPTGREHPDIDLFTPADDPHTPPRVGGVRAVDDEQILVAIADLLPRINSPECIWPLIGWHMATPLKPALLELGYKFPVLNMCGTKGSGKTTTLLQVFQPMLGYKIPRSYDVNTTQFVALSLLGSTSSVPIAFSEFRASTGTDFTRYVLLSYDSGRDARGRADQTTVEYPLRAPFTLDGEDRLEDPAALERLVVVMMNPAVIDEGTEPWRIFRELSQYPLERVARLYIEYTLSLDLPELLKRSEQDIYDTFTVKLPDRVRRNIIVTWLGVLAFADYMELNGCDCHVPGPEVMRTSLENVYSTKMGRAPIAADNFIEFMVNVAAHGTSAFPWSITNGTIWFQLTPAFDWYTSKRSRQRLPTLTRNAIRTQLHELQAEYVRPPEIRKIGNSTVLAYGVDLARAYEMGLDIPKEFRTDVYTIRV